MGSDTGDARRLLGLDTGWGCCCCGGDGTVSGDWKTSVGGSEPFKRFLGGPSGVTEFLRLSASLRTEIVKPSLDSVACVSSTSTSVRPTSGSGICESKNVMVVQYQSLL
jgi:hypothetical protein